MAAIQTNRDLYLAITGLLRANRENDRPLEDYLRALGAVAGRYRACPALTADEFFGLLSESFTAPAPPFDEAWRARYLEDQADLPGFAGWEARLRRQVVDLREMAENGTLQNELLYFGVDSPRGGHWYNFDPVTFLECATEGTFGGWQEGDDTGRDYVPGPVAAMGPDGKFDSRDAREIARPVVPIPAVSWEDFRDFLGQGQWYE